MKILFYIILILTIILFVLKLLFSVFYYYKINKKTKDEIDESKYTVLQPILSGDSRLEETLEENLRNTSNMLFIWLVDKSDSEAIRIVKEISEKEKYLERIVNIYLDDVPQNINPKIFKLAQGLKYIKTEYTIVLDDDSVLDIKKMNEMSLYEDTQEELIVTGIPYNYNISGFFSKMISAFINSNSIFTYFSMSFLNENKTINGMFYIIKTEILKKYNAFEEIKYWLCDDLALATYLLSMGVKIKQSTIFCNVRNTVPNLRRYILLIKRWLLFGKIYMKNASSIKFLFIIFLPISLPAILLFYSFYLGIDYIILIFNLFVGKVVLYYITRRIIYNDRGSKNKLEEIEEISLELVSELLLPFFIIYTFSTKPTIVWRNKKIKVIDGKIHYEI